MKKQLLLTAFVAFTFLSCMKSVDSPIGNILYRWSLKEYTGPDSDWKTLKSDSIKFLMDDGMQYTVTQVMGKVDGLPQWVNKYTGTIYQGRDKYWPTKPDFTFETTFINDSTFKLGNDRDGFNIGTFDGRGETLTIVEQFPVKGRKYVYFKVSD
jgi:hypothetical protein